MRLKSFSFLFVLGRDPEANVVALKDVQQLRQTRRQSGGGCCQGTTEPFTDL